jgi:hypothetical protein
MDRQTRIVGRVGRHRAAVLVPLRGNQQVDIEVAPLGERIIA